MTIETNQGVDLREVLYILRRRLRLVATVIILGVMLAVLVGTRQPILYTATTLIMVEPKEKRVVNVQSVVDQPGVDPAMLETHVKVLESRDQGLQVVDALNLGADPEFQRQQDGTSVLTAKAKQVLTAIIQYMPNDLLVAAATTHERLKSAAFMDENDLSSIPSTLHFQASGGRSIAADPRDYALAVYEKRLSVQESGKSYILAISFTSSNPDKAAQIANKSVSLYIASQISEKRDAIASANAWLAQRLEVMRAEYLSAQAKAQLFRVDNNIITTMGDEINDKQIAQLSSQLVTVRSEKSSKLAKLNIIKTLKRKGLKPDAVAEIVDSPLIMRLREEEITLTTQAAEYNQTYGGRHPKIAEIEARTQNLSAKLEATIDQIIASLQNEVDFVAAQEANVQQDIARAQAGKNMIADRLIKLSELDQQVEAARQPYEAFLQRFEETKQQGDLVAPDARIVSRAAPPATPDGVSLPFFALMGFIGSSFGAVMLAVFVDRQRLTIRRKQDLRQQTGLPCFGVVPSLSAKVMRAGVANYLAARPRSAFAETMHAVVAGLNRTIPDGGSWTIGVTSSVPGEGKSFIAVSLAVSLARLGFSTLLVDLDLRRPAVARSLGLKPAKGVAESLAGEISCTEAILHDESYGIDVLPVSAVPRDPVRLLSSNELMLCLSDFGKAYDRVVIDCPPTLGMNDMRLIGEHTKMVILVAEWDRTSKHALKAAYNELRDARVEIVGGVINKADLSLFERHGYGLGEREGYYSMYSRYYGDGQVLRDRYEGGARGRG